MNVCRLFLNTNQAFPIWSAAAQIASPGHYTQYESTLTYAHARAGESHHHLFVLLFVLLSPVARLSLGDEWKPR